MSNDNSCRKVWVIGLPSAGIGDAQMVVKADYRRDSASGLYRQTKQEVERYALITPRDRQFFPKLLGSGTYPAPNGRELWWVAQEFIRMAIEPSSRTAKAIVKRLRLKYNIEDVDEKREDCNWFVDVATGKPIIYDFAL
jgi:hypothetical protein